MATDRPADYSKWPVEIRKLYDTTIRAGAALQRDAFAAAIYQLDDLTEPGKDQMLVHAACSALLELTAHYFRDGGQAAIELAARILSSSANDTAREKAAKLLEVAISKFPPKGRA